MLAASPGTPIHSFNTLQLSQQADPDLYGKNLAATADSEKSHKVSHSEDQTRSNQRAGRLATKQADCMQQDRADSHS